MAARVRIPLGLPIVYWVRLDRYIVRLPDGEEV